MDEKKREAGLSFFERHKIRREQKEKEKQLRAAASTQVRNLIRQERLDEEKLGQGKPPEDSEGGQ